jgi:DNA polymerase III sliding clamp (beta) subunit (PCNA family)
LRLSEYKIIHEKDMNVDFSQIIPSKTCSAISRMFGDSESIKIVSGDNQIAFYTQNTKVYSRLLNGNFPDYV